MLKLVDNVSKCNDIATLRYYLPVLDSLARFLFPRTVPAMMGWLFRGGRSSCCFVNWKARRVVTTEIRPSTLVHVGR